MSHQPASCLVIINTREMFFGCCCFLSTKLLKVYRAVAYNKYEPSCKINFVAPFQPLLLPQERVSPSQLLGAILLRIVMIFTLYCDQ